MYYLHLVINFKLEALQHYVISYNLLRQHESAVTWTSQRQELGWEHGPEELTWCDSQATVE